uniref:Bm13367 n=1 Tax=Brugia malayi TaxID=6279 RepID=A0A1I9G065_BRUMA|nr:Bm13367 [Brugia malayi]
MYFKILSVFLFYISQGISWQKGRKEKPLLSEFMESNNNKLEARIVLRGMMPSLNICYVTPIQT